MKLEGEKIYRFNKLGKCVKCGHSFEAKCTNCQGQKLRKIYSKISKDYRFDCKNCTYTSYWAHCPECTTANPIKIFRNRLGFLSTLLLWPIKLFIVFVMPFVLVTAVIENRNLEKLKHEHNATVRKTILKSVQEMQGKISVLKKSRDESEVIWKEISETFKVLSAKIHIDEESKKISFKLTIKNERDVEISKVYFYVALNEPNKLNPIFEHSSRYGRKGNIKPGEEIVCHLSPNLTKIIEKKLLAPNNQFFLSAFIEGLEDKDGKILVDARISKEDREAFRKLEAELQRLQKQINQANPE